MIVLFLQCQMIVQDRLEKEKGIAKNAVESYVYDMRGKLYGELEKFITEEVCSTLPEVINLYNYLSSLRDSGISVKDSKSLL